MKTQGTGDEAQTIIIERGASTSPVVPFVLGALLGAGVALLLAPRSGAETQEEIRKAARRLRVAADDRLDDLQDRIGEGLDQARQGIRERVDGIRDRIEAGRDSVREAVSAGRSAAAEAKDELETRLEQSKAAYRAGVDAAREAARDVRRSHPDDDEVTEGA